ncbi:MAG: TonB-dependent receptor, partial [Pyrinomonadaceae bacterium]
ASYRPTLVNEFRFQYARRRSGARRNEFSGTGPSIIIRSVANFGPPIVGDPKLPTFAVTQFQDNVTLNSGTHVTKFGGGFSHHGYAERSPIFSQYRFLTIDKYIQARNGCVPNCYIDYTETFGDPEIRYQATYWNFFVQDDWKITRRLKLTYGLRYDLYKIPKADPTSPFPLSRKFNVDKNDLSPRIGVAYALREGNRPTVLRIGAGVYYDAPLLAIYRDVIHINGNPRFSSYTFGPGAGPTFPHTLDTLPAGSLLAQQDIFTIAPDFETMYAMHISGQIQQAVTEDLSFTAGYVHSAGRHINVYRDINPIGPVRYLEDGRPVFGNDHLDARFGSIVIAESGGVAQYDALTLQLNQRSARGLQFAVNYTLSKATNDAPDGDFEGLYLSDPTNRNVDRGYSSADQRHTFVMSLVARPQLQFTNRILRGLINHNQFGVIATANSGERFSIYSNFDLNNDGFRIDRPIGFVRNSERTPKQFNLDLRYSRLFSLSDRFQLEAFAEAQNLLNINSIVRFNNVSVVSDPVTGRLIGTLPDFRARDQSVAQDSRQIQLGVKFTF